MLTIPELYIETDGPAAIRIGIACESVASRKSCREER